MHVLLRIILRDATGSSPDRVLVCFHVGRCGSTVLGDLLDQHSQVEWDGEIFHGDGRLQEHLARYGTDDPMDIIDVRRGLSKGDVYALEVKPLWATQLGNINIPLDRFVGALQDGPATDFLILERKNYLRRLLSVVTGRERGVWHHRPDDEPEKIRVELPMDCVREGAEVRTVREWFELYDDVYGYLCDHLPGADTLRLTFEEDIRSDPTVAYRRVCEFLDLEVQQTKIRYDRTNTWPLEDMLDNYSTVASELDDTPWEWMLEEDFPLA